MKDELTIRLVDELTHRPHGPIDAPRPFPPSHHPFAHLAAVPVADRRLWPARSSPSGRRDRYFGLTCLLGQRAWPGPHPPHPARGGAVRSGPGARYHLLGWENEPRSEHRG